ncbi:Uma2 family endonuclease [Actinomadura rubrisoli]|uniref:Uma2 family endonuclease n=1 Tax=Actinomadura rubrisoli TaxID=2530368 RepID=A0A4R5C321_9ACTN|nr:Uma2 family endonuclease [Actinomadura rubrisoli]TDD94051.1 Uma2 family endonuclease [Actinomadura rubrisoli]
MTVLPDDYWLLRVRPQPVTAEEYELLPEDVSRMIEIVGGQVVFRESPDLRHQRAARRLADLIEAHARAAMNRGRGCLEVDTDVDLRLREVPLLNRRPDAVLYRCLDREDDERLRAEHALLVAEIVSPGSETVDTAHKLGGYAKAGIPHYWIVWLDETGVSAIERYQLDRPTRLYKHVNTLMREAGGTPEIGLPIPITVDWDELEY